MNQPAHLLVVELLAGFLPIVGAKELSQEWVVIQLPWQIRFEKLRMLHVFDVWNYCEC
jgi:hypothetical protein